MDLSIEELEAAETNLDRISEGEVTLRISDVIYETDYRYSDTLEGRRVSITFQITKSESVTDIGRTFRMYYRLDDPRWSGLNKSLYLKVVKAVFFIRSELLELGNDPLNLLYRSFQVHLSYNPKGYIKMIGEKPIPNENETNTASSTNEGDANDYRDFY